MRIDEFTTSRLVAVCIKLSVVANQAGHAYTTNLISAAIVPRVGFFEKYAADMDNVC